MTVSTVSRGADHAAASAARPRPHRSRRIRRVLGAITALAVLGAIASAGLLLALPGVGDAPTADDPLTHLAYARARQAHVLIRLIATGKLTPRQAAQAYRLPLHLAHGRAAGCVA